MNADSSNSKGTPFINPWNVNTPNGMPNPMYINNSVDFIFRTSTFPYTMTSGIMMTWNGSAIEASMTKKIAPLIFHLNRTNKYPVIAENKRMNATDPIVITMEFMKDCINPIYLNAYA